MILLLIVGFFVMMMLGIPVAFSMLGSSLLYIIVNRQYVHYSDISLELI